LSREVSVPQVPQVSSPVSVDLRPPVSGSPRNDSDDAFSQLLQANDEPAPEPRSRETASADTQPARDRNHVDRARGRDDEAKSKDDKTDAAGTDNSDADTVNDKAKEASDSSDGKGSDDQKNKDKKADQSADDTNTAAASAPVAPDASGTVNANATVAAQVAAPPVMPDGADAPKAAPDGVEAIGAAAAQSPQAPAMPQPQLPQQAQAPVTDAPQQQAQAVPQAAAPVGKPVVETKTDSAPQSPQPTDDKPQQAAAGKPVVTQQTALNVPVPAAPKPVDNVQPQSDKPVQPNASAVVANISANSAPKPDAKPAGNSGNHETLEDVLSKHFSGDVHLTANGQIVLPDATRTLPNNPAPMSVSLQTAPSAANNLPIPLQAAALAIEIASRAKDGSRQFDIRLDPPELGRIDVKLDVDKSGQVNTHLTVDRPETLDLLRRDAQGLERALQQAGLKTSDSGLEFSLRQQTPDGQFNGRNQAQTNPQANATTAGEIEQTATIHAEQYQWAARLRGGVDIRV
jgi:flagellar hook-length control protein FliK